MERDPNSPHEGQEALSGIVLSTEDQAVEKAPAPTEKKNRSASKRRGGVIPVTPQGDNAKDLVGAWIAWYQNYINPAPIPTSIIGRLGKQVKGLIVSGYMSNDVKNGLAMWTYKMMNNPSLSPNALDGMTWAYARGRSGEDKRQREALRRWLSSLNNSGVDSVLTESRSSRGARTKFDKREATRQALRDWVAEGEDE